MTKMTESIIKLWKELGVRDVHFEFSCGGDSMNDTSIVINGKDGSTIENDEISNYIDNEVYNQVEFYEASDGHYQGEMGTVFITLNDEGDDLDYAKSSQSEWSERAIGTAEVKLTEEQAKFIKDKVFNINGSQDDFVLNYKQDCILTDEEEVTAKSLEETIQSACDDYVPEEYEGEIGEWFTFTTNEEGTELGLLGNTLLVNVSKETTVWKDE